MQQRETLQERVYNDILALICEGELPSGASLPTLEELRRRYQVSGSCIRAVLGRLKENGYLSTARGRAARVLYQPAQNLSEASALGLSCDKKRLSSFYEVIQILFPSIYTRAAMACTQSQLEELNGLIPLLPSAKSACSDYFELNVCFSKIILSTVKNNLILYIVQSVMQHTMLPAALMQKGSNRLADEFLQSAAAMRRIYVYILEEDPANIKKQFQLLFKAAESMAQKATLNIVDIPESKHREFAALQYAGEYKYLLIAHDLYEKILEGKYPVGTFLPTISQTRKAYGAAKVTVQSAYRVLAALKAIKTIHGHGSKVIRLSFRAISDFDAETFQIKKQEYLETIELLQIICADIVVHAHSLPFLPLKSLLLGGLNPSHQYSSLILCRYLMKEVGSLALDTFYEILSRRLYWGTGLIPASADTSTEEKHNMCMEIADALEHGRTDAAIKKAKELLAALYQNARQSLPGSSATAI